MQVDNPDVQNAIAKLLKAGFQISPATLEMLKTESNPEQLVAQLLASNAIHPAETPVLEPNHFQTLQAPPSVSSPEPENSQQEPPIPHITSTALAESVKARIEILKDPTPELQGKGTIEDFVTNFRNRYFRLRDIITQRVDGKGVIDISEVKETGNGKERTKSRTVKVVGIVTNKTLSKNDNIIIELEDLTGQLSVIVQQRDSNLTTKARSVLLDQIICVEGAPVSSEMLIVKDLFLPDIPSQRRNNRAEESISALLLSDIHYGSRHFLDKVFQRVIDWLNGNEGKDEHVDLASTVKYIVINGDLVDGIGVYPNQLAEITVHDLNGQFKGLNTFLQNIPSHIHILITPGNHDGVRLAVPRPAIAEPFLESLMDSGLQVTSLGCPAQVSLHGVNLLIYHGDSLMDIMGALSKPEVEAGFGAMREMLRGRHLAPMYGKSTTLAPEPRDWLVIDEVPDILHCGHVHVTSVGSYRKTLIINSGTFQSQTDYQKLVGIVPTPGIVPLVNLHTLNVKTLNFT